MTRTSHRSLLALLFPLALLAGCTEEKVAEQEIPPRAIKYMKLGTTAGADERQLAGVVKAGTNADVAFEINGRIIRMERRLGDAVKKGDVLAQLDLKPIELSVEQAEFTLNQAKATLADAKSKLSQQEKLWKSRYTTKTALDTAKANFGTAEGQVGIARSQLDLRKRDLDRATLKAPFDGKISKRNVEVFEEVQAGAPIYTLQTSGEYEVDLSVPESLIRGVSVGQEVGVQFPSLEGKTGKGLISEVSPEAGDGNAFPVTVRLTEAPEETRSGMSAEIILTFDTIAKGNAFPVPVAALKPDVNQDSGTVFIYDPKEEVVRQRAVQVVGIKGNTPEIIGDVKAGDIIATAGVGQLYDGMKVRLLDPKQPF